MKISIYLDRSKDYQEFSQYPRTDNIRELGYKIGYCIGSGRHDSFNYIRLFKCG